MVSAPLHPYRYQASYSRDVQTLEMTQISIAPIPRGGHSSDVSLTHHPQHQTLFPKTHRPFRLPLVILLFIFLPIPPLLSLLYLTTGHAILRQIYKSSSSSIYHTPILSSAEAGATGGLVFSLPTALLLYLLKFYHRQQSVPEDFFEDDDSITSSSAFWMTYIGYLACVLFVVGIGGVAGPLGVTCLSSGILNALVITKKMLSTGAAAAAGIVGGVVLSLGILLLGALTALVWLFWTRFRMRRKYLSS